LRPKNDPKTTKKASKTFKSPSNDLQMASKWLPRGRGREGGGGGVLLVSTAIGFAIYHITRFNFF
jgi:hypothetical protein